MPGKQKDFQSPGQALKYFLEQKDWTQEDLSFILSISLKHTNELIKDKKPISLELAKLLENVFNLDAMEWVKLVAKYQLNKNTDLEKGRAVKLKADVYHYMPINELIKKGWIKNTNNLEGEIRSFWNLSKKGELDLSFLNSHKANLEYRKSEAFESSFNEFNALIWHQMAMNSSRQMKAKPFNKKGLIELMDLMYSYTNKEDGVKEFLSELNNVGVKFVFLSHLSKTYLDGAAFLADGAPVVALTGRYDRVDNFWFTLAHELAHVMLHLTNGGSNSIFIDDTTKSKEARSNSIKEQEANTKAEELLHQNDIFQHFLHNASYITDDKVEEFSSTSHIHPSIVVGMLAFNDLASYSTLQRFKESVREKIPTKYKAEK
jgi:HTH-type transcriptional regulator / antitoxin HigA